MPFKLALPAEMKCASNLNFFLPENHKDCIPFATPVSALQPKMSGLTRPC
jgi:hypothetical protein